MSSVIPKEPAEIGTTHRLKCGKFEDVFEWRGNAWGLPDNKNQSSAATMYSLGWRYVQPSERKPALFQVQA